MGALWFNSHISDYKQFEHLFRHLLATCTSLLRMVHFYFSLRFLLSARMEGFQNWWSVTFSCLWVTHFPSRSEVISLRLNQANPVTCFDLMMFWTPKPRP